MPENLQLCPLCYSASTRPILSLEQEIYYRCSNCKLVFLPRRFHISAEEEKQRYDLHENDPADPNYRQFLDQMCEPMLKFLSNGDRGLDFGSGPGPTLNLMFEEHGHPMEIYDVFYDDNPDVFDNRYDFITATEVAEHLGEPGNVLQKLWNCLKSGGYLGIMTKRLPDLSDFEDWHYRKDDTHVTFYDEETFRWMANNWNGKIVYMEERVVIIKKGKDNNDSPRLADFSKKHTG